MTAWQTANTILVPLQAPTDHSVVFLNTATGVYLECGASKPIPAANAWIDVDLTPLGVPTNALAVVISGFLITSDGTTTGVGDLAVAFQAPGANGTPGNYDMQTLSIGPTGGSRTNGSVTVPLVNGHMQWAWLRGDNYSGQWPGNAIPPYPQGAAYGINLSVQQVFLP